MFDQDYLYKLEARYAEVEQLLGSPEIIANNEQYNKLAKELADLREPVFLFREYEKCSREASDLSEMLKEKHDSEFVELAKSEQRELVQKIADLQKKIAAALTVEDKDANKDVIVEIRQGTGGLEAALFAADLYRMYTKYAAQNGWTIEFMSSHQADLEGFKEVVFAIKGKGVYRRLKFESGVHRVQRVPETEAQGRIHTSTATVAVLIEPEDVEFTIEPKDLKIDTYRASSAGGQHMQKTDSAVRITHLPTNTVVTCQDERSQSKNKSKAMRILRARLLDVKQQEEARRMTEARRSQIGTGDRSEKIRTYNFPDRRVTDHRINFTIHQLEAVLEGRLEELTDALLKAEAEKKAQAQKDEQ